MIDFVKYVYTVLIFIKTGWNWVGGGIADGVDGHKYMYSTTLFDPNLNKLISQHFGIDPNLII